MRSNILIKFISILFFSLSALALAENDFVIYSPQNRSSEELVSIARDLFPENARLTSTPNKIIINAPENVSKKILSLFKELDHKPNRFRIFGREISESAFQAKAKAMEVSARSGPISVNKNSGVLPKNAAGRVSVGGISYGASEGNARGIGNGSHFVDSLEGSESTLLFGLREMPSGIAVRVKSAGPKNVNIKLRQQSADGLRNQNLQTDLDIQLNQWHTVGAINVSQKASNDEILGHSQSAGGEKKLIQIKVLKLK